MNDIQYVYEVWQRNYRFRIYERAYHVMSEVIRVKEFKSICEDQSTEDTEKGDLLGKLMNQSHESLRDLYECSSEELEELTQLAKDNGALGSRVTGAGWGGCCISLIKEDIADEFVDKIYDYYTKEREPGRQLWVTDDLSRYTFATKPSSGA